MVDKEKQNNFGEQDGVEPRSTLSFHKRQYRKRQQPFMDADSIMNEEEQENVRQRLWKAARNRNMILIVFLSVAFVAMFVSATRMQLGAQAAQSNQDESGARRQIQLKAERGQIVDRDGVVLATSEERNMLYWANADLEADRFNEVLLDLGNTLEAYDLEYGKAIEGYIDIEDMAFAMSDESIIYWQRNTNFLGLQELPEDVESDYRDNRYVKTSAEDLYRYLAYTRFQIDEDYSSLDVEKILRLRFEIYMSNWSFSQGTPVLIASDIPDELVTIFAEQNFRFQGAVTTVEPVRVYTEDAIYLAPVIGYIGQISAEQYSQLNRQGYGQDAIVGKTGIELVAERYLQGRSGLQVYNVWGTEGADGDFVSEIDELAPVTGDDLQLTIDMAIQRSAIESLARLIDIYNNDDEFEEFPDSTGAAVMIDLQNDGAILAMASLPTFNPQDFLDMSDDEDAALRVEHYLTDSVSMPMLNRAISMQKAPGSTFKVFTAASLLKNGVVNQHTIVDCPGYYEIDGMRFDCEGVHGEVDLEHAIAYSCNVYFYQMGVELGIDLLSETTADFGFGSRTGIELYNETTGILASRETKALYNQDPSNQLWYPADTAQTSIGQGLSTMSVLQLARATGLIATGEVLNPHIIDQITAADNTITMKTESNSELADIDDSLLQIIRDSMYLMTTDELSTVRGHFEGASYTVGSKTGTAQTLVNEYGLTTDGLYIAFAPYENPEVAVAVMVETGARGAATASVARDMLDTYFNDEDYEIGVISNLPGIDLTLE